MIVLAERKIDIATMTLLRSSWEALIRGLWLARCASEDEVDRFADDDKAAGIWDMITAIEKTEGFAAEILSKSQPQ